MSDMSKIHDKLKQAIERSPKSRYRLWQETGIKQSHLSRFIAGTRGLGVDNAEKLAKALGLELVLRKKNTKRKKKKV